MTNDPTDHELEQLRARIESAKPELLKTPQSKPDTDGDESLKKTMRVATDMIGTPIVCGAVGMGVDEWFQTRPLFFLILAFLGVCAGFWNLYRAQIGADSAVGFKRLHSAEKKGNKAQPDEGLVNNDPTP